MCEMKFDACRVQNYCENTSFNQEEKRIPVCRDLHLRCVRCKFMGDFEMLNQPICGRTVVACFYDEMSSFLQPIITRISFCKVKNANSNLRLD